MALAIFKIAVGPSPTEVGSIPILSAFRCRNAGGSERRSHCTACAPVSAFLLPNSLQKGGDPHVARTNPQTDFALILRRLSFQVEPTGPGASFASASAVSQIATSSSVPPPPMTPAFSVSIATAPLCKRPISSPRSWTTRSPTARSPRPTRSPTSSRWAAVRSPR